jgi:hypothetical protein
MEYRLTHLAQHISGRLFASLASLTEVSKDCVPFLRFYVSPLKGEHFATRRGRCRHLDQLSSSRLVFGNIHHCVWYSLLLYLCSAMGELTLHGQPEIVYFSTWFDPSMGPRDIYFAYHAVIDRMLTP